MVILIAGATHTGKTFLAQKLLETYHYPYVSIDHIKMGLIRSGLTDLKPTSSHKDLTDYLWPVMVGIIKTNIENKQHIIIEGSYMPFDYETFFDKDELKEIHMLYLIFSKSYIENHYDQILEYASIIESRLEDDMDQDRLIEDSLYHKLMCDIHNVDYIYIKDRYDIDQIIKRVEDF